jgi:tRNA-specific 2-thiouridylase
MKIFVGLSGGVDSAVSAALLQQQGYRVEGVFIKIWRPEFIECTWKEDRLDALRVCAMLSIPFREIDLSAEYKKEVVDAMLRDYAAGITPNPDVLCNRAIKFGAFLEWARREGANAVATGHYAQVNNERGRFQLLRGRDANKDQSYFLYTLTQTDLAQTIFPVGAMEKKEVRSLAEEMGLPVAQKHDSQGLCFIGDVSMDDFLRRYVPFEEGVVLDTAGAKIGLHKGAALYTIGERHGFSVTDPQAARAPLYVTDINVVDNTIAVSSSPKDAATDHAVLHQVNWIDTAPEENTIVEIQTRYRQKPVAAQVRYTQGNTFVQFEEPAIAPPGQSLVLYKGDVCLGGGIIQKVR